MNKAFALALTAVGIILLIYGIHESNSFASSVSNAVNGKPTDHSVWLIVAGVAGIVLGGGGILFGPGKRS